MPLEDAGRTHQADMNLIAELDPVELVFLEIAVDVVGIAVD